MSFNKLTGAILFALASQAANASGFALIEQSASGQGLSYAGAAANAEDASVMWFNPAGLTEIEGSQAILGAHVVIPKTEFTDNGSTFPVSESNAGVNGFVPNVYWKGDYKEYDLGFGVNVPYGSKVEYEPSWAGKYYAIDTDLKSINLNANLARKINDNISFGAGLNAQYINLDMNQAFPFGNGIAAVEADSWGFGYNLGLLAKLTEATRVGVSYRSEVKHVAKGTGDFGGLIETSATSKVTLPATAMLSLSHRASDNIQVLADATWTGWKAYDELVINYGSGAPVSSSETNQNFEDSMRYSLGMIYNLDDNWKLRTGVALDNTPVPNAESLSPRTPDSDRTWLSAGFGYKHNNAMSIDAAYTRIIGNQVDIYRTSPTLLKGTYDTSIDILSAQLVWNY